MRRQKRPCALAVSGRSLRPNLNLTPQSAAEFNAASNRMTAPNAYDAVGNLTSNKVSQTASYDAENRMITFNGGLGVANYRYDGDRRRISQQTAAGATTYYVYNASGQLAAEYSTQAPAGSGTSYLTTDHLGSTRIVTDAAGTPKTRHDYVPYGEEIDPQYGGRAGMPGYTATLLDGPTQKFTAKERDAESGLDYFGARYLSSAQGRFTSSDDFAKDSHVGDPQSWNKYAYARNNPLRYVDRNGQNATVATSCTTAASGATKCDVKISASIAIYAEPGSGITAGALSSAAATMETSIEGAWRGSFTQDGVTYNVSTDVTVSVAGSAGSAMNSGAQNVIGLTSGPIALPGGKVAGAFVQPKSLFTLLSGGPDQGKMDIGHVANYSKHEFSHLLGIRDKPGGVLSNTNPWMRPASALPQDYRWGLQEATWQVNRWLHQPPSRSMRYGEVFDGPSPGQTFTGRTPVGAPFLWWK
jgi:RHS repeat-associated protein